MKLAQLQSFFPKERHRDVEALYDRFARTNPERAEDIESFVQHLHHQGILSTDTMAEVLTLHEVALSTLPAVGDEVPETRYRMLAMLAKGAMGEVHIARDPNLRRTVAVKRIDPRHQAKPTMLQRFFAEAQITAQLDHPNIVPIYGLEQDTEGRLTYAMKFVRGKTLTDFMHDCRDVLDKKEELDEDHSLKARIESFLPVLNAMDYAHRRGIIHRDLKPDNVMVGAFGEVLVMDWGIARPIGGRERVTMTATGSIEKTRSGAVVGTPSYMSPEQAAGKTEELTAASDQYALGIILFELVSLRRAVTAESPLETLTMSAAGLKHPLKPYSKQEPIARELRAIIGKATARDPNARYADCDAFGDDLRRFLRDEEVQADPDGVLRRLKRWVGQHRGFAMALVGLLLVLGVAFAFLVHTLDQARAQERERRMQAVLSIVGEQAAAMNDKLDGYEALLQGIVSVAEEVVVAPAPEVPQMVLYRYKGGKSDPPAPPEYAKSSKVYGERVSFEYPDMSIPPDADPVASRPRALQLWRLNDVLKKAQLTSLSPSAVALSAPEAERTVLEQGVPLVWAYMASREGVTVGVPGIWTYVGDGADGAYDARTRGWFQSAIDKRGPIWNSAGIDESGLGLLVTCSQAVYDDSDKFAGVAAVDMTFNYFIDELLENERLVTAGTEAFIVDGAGNVVVRSSQKADARDAKRYKTLPFAETAVLEATKGHATGHIELDGGRLAMWSRLQAAPWTYIVIGETDKMLAVAAPK